MKPEEFLDALGQERGIAILRTAHAESASRAMEAAIVGGFRIVEFTLTTPGALDLIAEFSWHGDLIVGAGTILSAQSARDAVARGAKFLASPVMDPEVIAEALKLGISIVPGAHTPTEMLNAYRLGAPLQKVFPAPAGGPVYITSCLGPMPFLRLVPTQGVDLSNAVSYLQAGAFAVGFGNAIFDPADVEQQRFDQIEARAKILHQTVASFRKI
jgi:2-dehydro-3-deoxyphosphogluconate aldolase/(4S)-4-hydroxy-2-oxoglutarate aldolase